MVFVKFNPALVEEFKCPECTTYLFPPIKQCEKGHNYCQSCFEKNKKCPQCSSKKFTDRSKVMEEMAEFMEFPCQYKTVGCEFKGHYESVKVHQECCKLAKYYVQIKTKKRQGTDQKTTKTKDKPDKPYPLIKDKPENSENVLKDLSKSSKPKDKRYSIKINPEFAEDFRCIFCNYYMYPPIYQCKNGHKNCSYCLGELGHCYVCLEQLSENCDAVTNQILENLEFPCKFENLGCQFHGHYLDVLCHQMSCKFNEDSDESTISCTDDLNMLKSMNDMDELEISQKEKSATDVLIQNVTI